MSYDRLQELLYEADPCRLRSTSARGCPHTLPQGAPKELADPLSTFVFAVRPNAAPTFTIFAATDGELAALAVITTDLTSN